MKRPRLAVIVLVVVLALEWGYIQIAKDGTDPMAWLRSLNPWAATSSKTISSSEAGTMALDLAPVRMAVAEYYMTLGALPRKFDGLGMPAPRNTRLLENGAIEYRVGGRDTARVYLRIKTTLALLSWDCISPDVANIPQRMDGCRYLPKFDVLSPIQEPYSLTHRLLFEFDRDSEQGLDAGTLAGFKRFLADAAPKPAYHLKSVQITGYADPMGDARRNVRLAEGRTAYVRDSIAALGIDRAIINARVIGADPRPVRDCPASLPREERIDCFGPSRRVEITLSGDRDL